MKITHYATATDDRPPLVVSAVDFADNWPFAPHDIEMHQVIHEDGTTDRDGAWFLGLGVQTVLVQFENGFHAVTSPEGLAAYLTRTGQTPTPPPERLGTRAWVEANATPEPPTEPHKPSTLAQAFAAAHTAPKFDPELAGRRTSVLPTSPADMQIGLTEEQRKRLAEEVTAEPADGSIPTRPNRSEPAGY